MSEYEELDSGSPEGGEGTVPFLPERLNRDPIVLRGMTNDEMVFVAVLGAVVGLVIGLLGWLLTGEIAMAPSLLFLVAAVFLMSGGSILRRKKRGKPETWLYRHIQYTALRRYNLNLLGAAGLIRHSGPWSLRRTQLPAPPKVEDDADAHAREWDAQ